MQAFGHQMNSYLMDDSQPVGPAPTRYAPMAGRADRLMANIPGGVQSSWGMNGDHMTTGLGGSNN